MPSVAVIGAGPSGLAAARYLKSEGFTPVVFEQARTIGGHWSGDDRASSVWPSMHTNTTRVLTAFSDFPHAPGTPIYPTNQTILAYLGRYADAHGLMPHVRTETRVERVARAEDGSGWTVDSRSASGTASAGERFSHVVVAAGRYQTPVVPEIPGLESFGGECGVIHTRAYKDPDRYRGRRVLVAGCAISALEVASDLAMLGAERVVTTNRRQRYVLPKLNAGVPTDHVAFSRVAGLAAEWLPPEAIAASMKGFVLRTAGNPESFGAPRPADDIFAAGISLSQHYLPLVAEGRIDVKPWIGSVSGSRVTFLDGTEETFDAIICGTGYVVDLPFLDQRTRATLDLSGTHMDLHGFTFHPDLPNLAFVGLVHQVGPVFPVAELQARWVAYAWSGARPLPDDAGMRRGVEAYRARRHLPQVVPMHITARVFAGAAGVEPDVAAWPALVRPLLFGPLAPVSYRISGRDARPDAVERTVREAAEFGVAPVSALTPEQSAQLQALAAASRDRDFAAFVGKVTARTDA
jgi:cation diffusion facilitator CzcD-associated flavoprotein CzcO